MLVTKRDRWESTFECLQLWNCGFAVVELFSYLVRNLCHFRYPRSCLLKIDTSQALCECVGNHKVGSKRNKTYDGTSVKLPTKMDVNVNMTRRFPANRISRHSDAGQIIFINISGRSLFVTNIAKKRTKVKNFLANLTRNLYSASDVEGDGILTTGLPGHRSTSVRSTRVASISIANPVRIHPPTRSCLGDVIRSLDTNASELGST